MSTHTERREQAAQIHMLLAQLLVEAQALRAQSTERTARMMGQNLNDVLETAVGVFGPSGAFERDFRAAYATVAVSNTSTGLVTVSSAPQQASPPMSGAGMFEVPAGAGIVMSLVGTSLTFYGPPAGRFSYTVFSRPQQTEYGRVLT